MSAQPVITDTSGFAEGLDAYRRGDYLAATTVLESLVRADPTHIEARHVLALSELSMGRSSSACANLREVLRCQPRNAEAWSNYGAVLRELGLLDDADEALRSALSLDSGLSKAWNNLGAVRIDQGHFSEADTFLSEAMTRDPSYADAQTNLARVRFETGRVGQAHELARAATALKPESAEAHNRLSFALAAAGRVTESIECLRTALSHDPGNDRLHSNLLFRLQADSGQTADDLVREASAWGDKHRQVSLTVRTGQVRKIGFVSGDFRHHPVGFFVHPLIQELAKRYQVVCYSNNRMADAWTERLREAASDWRTIWKVDTNTVASAIKDDDIDVLVDLSGHTGDNRLDVFALRPAQIQVSWLGYPGSTGLRQVDAVIADPVLVPPGQEGQFVERTWRLRDSFLCWSPDTLPGPRGPRTDGPIVFGVLNNPGKYSSAAFDQWAAVLRRVTGSNLLFRYSHCSDRWVQRQIRNQLETRGIDPARIRFAGHDNFTDRWEAIRQIDVALDSFPYSGATTTLDCVAAGVPVVTRTGDRYASRMSASLLGAVGGSELVASDESSYVQIAESLASDLDHCRSLGHGLAARMPESPVCQPASFAESFAALVESQGSEN